jgi:mxaK protein
MAAALKPIALGLALLCLALAAAEGWRWRTLAAEAEDTAALLAGRDIGVERRFQAGDRVRLAYALYLARTEQDREAAELLEELAQRGDPDVRAAALYDLGNLRLRRALAETESSAFEKAGAYADLAKDAYRRALRVDPGLRDAKFNLEVASRLLPDFDPVDSGVEKPDEDAARKLWTRVPGFPRGLP